MASFRNLGYCASTDEIGCRMLCQILPRHLNEFCSASSETTSKILWTCLTHASEKTAIHFCFHGRVEDERSQGRPRIRWMDVIKNCSRPILERRPSSLGHCGPRKMENLDEAVTARLLIFLLLFLSL